MFFTAEHRTRSPGSRRCAPCRPPPCRLTDGAVERKGREGRKEIQAYFASLATSAFDRDVLYGRTSNAISWLETLCAMSSAALPPDGRRRGTQRPRRPQRNPGLLCVLGDLCVRS